MENLDRQSVEAEIMTRYGTTNKHVSLPAGVVRLHSAPEGCYQYDAHLTNLAPDTLYYYGIFNGDFRLTTCSPTYFFRTLPLPGSAKPMRFWVVGDSGTGRPTQFNVQSSMSDWITAEKHPLDFYIHVGDMAYTRGRDVEFQSRFFDMYDATLRNTVCWPAMGNHEGATSKGTNGSGRITTLMYARHAVKRAGWRRAPRPIIHGITGERILSASIRMIWTASRLARWIPG